MFSISFRKLRDEKKENNLLALIIKIYIITKSMRALWLVNQLWVIVTLYNNQINARALIGQSAVGYCAGKPT